MQQTISIPLSIAQIRLLREVTVAAAREEVEVAATIKSTNGKEQHLIRATRLGELAEVFAKTCP